MNETSLDGQLYVLSGAQSPLTLEPDMDEVRRIAVRRAFNGMLYEREPSSDDERLRELLDIEVQKICGIPLAELAQTVVGVTVEPATGHIPSAELDENGELVVAPATEPEIPAPAPAKPPRRAMFSCSRTGVSRQIASATCARHWYASLTHSLTRDLGYIAQIRALTHLVEFVGQDPQLEPR